MATCTQVSRMLVFRTEYFLDRLKILDCFYLKIVLNIVSTIGFTTIKLNALNFKENYQTLPMDILKFCARVSIFYLKILNYRRCKWFIGLNREIAEIASEKW